MKKISGRHYQNTLRYIWDIANDTRMPNPPQARWDSAVDMLFALQFLFLNDEERRDDLRLLTGVAAYHRDAIGNAKAAA